MDDVSVLVVSHASGLWGAQRQLLGIAPELARRGVRLTLAAPDSRRWTDAWQAAGLERVRLELPAHRGLRGEGGTGRPGPLGLAREAVTVLESARRISRVARHYDVVLSASLAAHVETALAGRLARRPSVLMLVDIVVPGFGRRMLQQAARLATTTIVNSTATGATVAGASTELVHPGVDIEVYAPGPVDPVVRAGLGAGERDWLVGIVGRLDEEKGVHILLEAADGLVVDGRPVKVAVVGDVGTGPDRYADSLRARAAGLGDRVGFAGRRDDVPEVIRALDLLVNASRAEPFGLSVLEAQASGVPVVASDAGGIPDFVEHDVTGLLFAPFDASALRRELERALADVTLRSEIAAAARRQAVERFAVAGQFDRYASIFRRCARAR